ncbi:IS110 family transposase [Mesorhizobium sp. M1C.F.Ca.ET.193.01.1.1]|uniref:IS110 family transposase n=3 Tax=Mesorhizobium TaxID=68287 RepID=UPI000FD5FD88|nr:MULTISPECIES: IS110 family transposase [unclassified Mesorhizobium]TGQ49581.1 IS110 family transposase [Mesorhizobium sp. M1C.F.Ca.ET.210.01.1.1]TGQ63493.1 IS110 family transposase [Mesorhizobium sp. M1C.F.Ca.ET.212.01.1.1]TGQ97170.1 IS110 family transposase [Mesorhizobium sp. M1C.F.Ca.ET.204.01.1.1]TGR17264.1 IS110 family transposase [Mesorhizobium sp. M1C.F.Ca.ET.196.01.1.1]TGR39307.1 IS110 family transposase [Mesorhizobium sp. M1C.F.Ca.ET.195.01.1.1]
MNKTICGVDVSKEWLDAHIEPSGAAGRFRNDAAGIAELAAWCQGHGVELAVMEASGGGERLAFLLLWELSLPCALVNARNVRRFAEAMGFLEKTDRIDAAMIVGYAQAKRVQATPPPSAAEQRLKALVARLGQVTGDLTIQKQRKSAAANAEIIASLDEVMALLVRQSRRLEGEIASLIDDDPLWACLDRAFRSLKGVASRSVARLMAELPEIGILSNKAIAKLAGLAPIANDSGKRSGRRPVRGGRAGPRSLLFLIARIVAKYDPHLAAFHQRLQAAGKEKMVIRIALARKLLVILNAKARDARSEFANAT